LKTNASGSHFYKVLLGAVKLTKMKYIVYYLDERDFSENEMYADRRKLLQEVEDESRFDTKEEAVERAKSLVAKNIEVAVLEVYCA
jgi:hypothetical protein